MYMNKSLQEAVSYLDMEDTKAVLVVSVLFL
jgi:hypothetical protein